MDYNRQDSHVRDLYIERLRRRIVTLALIAVIVSLVYVPWEVEHTSTYTGFAPLGATPPVLTSTVFRTNYALLWGIPAGIDERSRILWDRVLLQVLAIVAAAALACYLAPETAVLIWGRPLPPK